MAMAYSAVANGGIAYEPRLIKKVLHPDGTPALDENGQVAVPEEPKIRGNLHSEGLTTEQIEIVRHGLWNVVNESGGPGGGGTGSKARVQNLVVAGKTGTAQATDRGKKSYIAWFACFAPYDKPKYVIVVAVQGGNHGGGVAAPVAAHILEQCVAMDQGSYKVELTALAPAHSAHPFATFDALDYKNTEKVTITEEDAGTHDSSANVDMGRGAAHPDIKTEADARGKVGQARKPAPTPQPVDRRNFFQKLFGVKPNPPPRTPSVSPPRGGH
jgi:penicillin-binding protein 2